MRRREREWRGRHLSTCILDRHLCLYSQGDLKTQFNIDSTALKESPGPPTLWKATYPELPMLVCFLRGVPGFISSEYTSGRIRKVRLTARLST